MPARIVLEFYVLKRRWWFNVAADIVTSQIRFNTSQLARDDLVDRPRPIARVYGSTPFGTPEAGHAHDVFESLLATRG